MAKTDGKRERGTRSEMGRVPLYIGSEETAERYGPHPESWALGAAKPGRWGQAWKRFQAHSVAMEAALAQSTDGDARNARLLAAHLTRMADEFEALDAENALLPVEERAGDRRIVETHRKIVRDLVHAFYRVERDEWIAFVVLVGHIERAAFVRMHPREVYPKRVWEKYASMAADSVTAAFRRAFRREGKRVTTAMVRAAIVASRDYKNSASKWKAFVPIAKVMVGESKETTIRREIARVRKRLPT
jgi:hypothetical protein